MTDKMVWYVLKLLFAAVVMLFMRLTLQTSSELEALDLMKCLEPNDWNEFLHTCLKLVLLVRHGSCFVMFLTFFLFCCYFLICLFVNTQHTARQCVCVRACTKLTEMVLWILTILG